MAKRVTPTRDLTILTFDDARIGLPSREVVAVEMTWNIKHGDHGRWRALGKLTRSDRDYAVYGFSPSLQLLKKLPGQRLFCACLAGDKTTMGIALACETVAPAKLDREIDWQAVPDCLRSGGTPLRYFFKHREHLVLVSNTTALTAYIASLEKHAAQQL